MCGFVGLLRTGRVPLPPASVIRRMAGAVSHRGPDDAGEFLGDDVHLAVVRLAIVDLKGGHQPALGCNADTTVVYNGEIYNRLSLSRELQQRRHRLIDACDTTVLPHLYEEDGIEFLNRLRGMFALALWDARQRCLVLARDRLGIKPLYFAQTEDFLLFGSEIKALFASGMLDAYIDPASIDDLFSLSYPCPPRTMFRGVFELRPAHWAYAQAGQRISTPRRYWRAPFRPRFEYRRSRRADLESEFHERLRRTVYQHLISDVPVAAYLSGGLDSSAIAALVRETMGDPPTTFSVAFENRDFDETKFSTAMAASLDAPNFRTVCNRSIALEYPSVVWHTELPLQFPLALPMMRLSALARRQGYPVVLTGEGADETLGGYDCFRADRLRRLFNRAGLRHLRPWAYRSLYRWAGTPLGLPEFLLRVEERPAEEIRRSFGGVYPSWYHLWQMLDLERTPLFGPQGRSLRPAGEPPAEFSALVREDAAELHPLDAALALELETRLPSWILLIGDRASMANAIEARVPFLDHELLEFTAPLPPSMRLRGLTEKSILRGAMKGLLPEAVRKRQKRPFYTPIAEWFFADPVPPYVDELLGERALRATGLFEPKVVDRLRTALHSAPARSLLRIRLEWILILTLGTQLLHRLFVQGRGGSDNMGIAAH